MTSRRKLIKELEDIEYKFDVLRNEKACYFLENYNSHHNTEDLISFLKSLNTKDLHKFFIPGIIVSIDKYKQTLINFHFFKHHTELPVHKYMRLYLEQVLPGIERRTILISPIFNLKIIKAISEERNIFYTALNTYLQDLDTLPIHLNLEEKINVHASTLMSLTNCQFSLIDVLKSILHLLQINYSDFKQFQKEQRMHNRYSKSEIHKIQKEMKTLSAQVTSRHPKHTHTPEVIKAVFARVVGIQPNYLSKKVKNKKTQTLEDTKWKRLWEDHRVPNTDKSKIPLAGDLFYFLVDHFNKDDEMRGKIKDTEDVYDLFTSTRKQFVETH